MTYETYTDNYDLSNFVSYEDDWIGDLLTEDFVEEIDTEVLNNF